MFFFYNLLLTILSPFWGAWMWLRARGRKEQPDWGERFGNLPISPRKDRKRIWIHAVSVGEVVAAMPILREIRTLLPEHEIVLSVTTSSGHRTAREQATGLYDHLVYFPIDVLRFTLNAIQRTQPAVVAIMETELWMNFLWSAKVFDCRTLLLNGRISDRSFPRARKVRFFYRALLAHMDRCLMQTAVDAERIRTLGATSAETLGNCKFDQAISGLDADPSEWRRELGLTEDRPVVVIGSTRGDDEEQFVLQALREVGLERMQVVHAPRHLERAEPLAASVSKSFGSVARRSLQQKGDYLVLDTYGELDKVYAAADVAIVGGGFGDYGGQNVIQPLAHGKPVLHGTHMQNFREVAEAALAAGASESCATPHELAEAVRRLLDDPMERARRGEAARMLIQANLGASRRYAEAIAAEAATVPGKS